MPPRTPRRSTRRTIMKAEIGRFDSILKPVGFTKGDTVEVLLEKASIEFHKGEEINDDRGNAVSLTDKAKDGQSYYITGNFSNGI